MIGIIYIIAMTFSFGLVCLPIGMFIKRVVEMIKE